MGIKLTIEVTSPLTRDEAELLQGISVMTHAVASHELPDDNADDPSIAEVEASSDELNTACGTANEDGTALCASRSGHRGRHHFPRIAPLN
jgi:hypothetical protein